MDIGKARERGKILSIRRGRSCYIALNPYFAYFGNQTRLHVEGAVHCMHFISRVWRLGAAWGLVTPGNLIANPYWYQGD
jgi:hypothetical protein